MKLSVLIPVYNEEGTIDDLLSAVLAVEVDKEVIVVDDCSTDDSLQLLSKWQDQVRVLRHTVNRGKGAAVRTALAAATGDAVIIQDADLEYDPNDYGRLMAPIERGEAKVVYGVRSLAEQKPLMRFGNNVMTLATNLLYGTRLKDVETCYKVLTREVVDRLDLQSERFELETELTAQIVQLGYEIHEEPISYHPRYGEGKKLTPMDGLPTLWALIRYRIKPIRR
ncbi:MAG: glycosyltransferase family 2 protein [Anaerolineae bacterium]|nr:glycosyltransferase family 2 protein [Anaerolineae bacterium]